MICALSECDHDVFEDGLCIFHCKKNSWYSTHNKFKKWDTDLLDTFWTMFHTLVKTQKKCTNFVFPQADYYIDETCDNPNEMRQWSEVTLENINFNGSTFLTNPIYHDSIFRNCSFRNCHAESMLFISCTLDSCNFQGIPISDLTIDGSEIDNSNFQWVSFNQTSMSSSKITNSNFNNSYFDYLDLSASFVKNCSFQNTTLLSGTRDTYRILKHYHDEVKNDIQASQYYSKEMQEYCKYIFISPYYSLKTVFKTYISRFKNTYTRDRYPLKIKNDIQQLFRDLKELFSEGPILIANLLISNYGQNWFMPLFWFTVSSTVIFNHIMPTSPFDINQFAMFINPFLNSTDAALYKSHYALWLIHKVLATIFLYHFVMAVKQKTRRIN